MIIFLTKFHHGCHQYYVVTRICVQLGKLGVNDGMNLRPTESTSPESTSPGNHLQNMAEEDQMSFEHKKILRIYGDYLLNHVKPTEKLIASACDRGLLNPNTAQEIREIPDSHSKVAKVIRIVKTSGPDAFRLFCDVLEDSNQDIAGQLLRSAELASILKGRIQEELPKSLSNRLEANISRVEDMEQDLSRLTSQHKTETRRLENLVTAKDKRRRAEVQELNRRVSGLEDHVVALLEENREQRQQILTLEWALRTVSESTTGYAIDLHSQERPQARSPRQQSRQSDNHVTHLPAITASTGDQPRLSAEEEYLMYTDSM